NVADQGSKPSKREWLQAKSHAVTHKHLDALMADSVVDEIMIGETSMKYLSMATALERLQKEEISENILPALNDNTDLVPAIYEGGLKIWECTWDLLQFLASSDIKFKGFRVLELGCGAGLPAIYTMLHGANVILQDYNEEVINYITVPNVLLNTVDFSVLEKGNNSSYDRALSELFANASFYSGDWAEFERLLSNNSKHIDESLKFDLILTSETIYNTECHEKLLSLITNSVKQNGKILLAAKSYYFGVGGGIHQFCELVKKKEKLDFKTVLTNEAGVKREILELTLRR
ncbi:Histidine protein methyltransferase 1, partial [Halocaridina rubra]